MLALASGTITASATTTSSITPQLGTITGGTAPYSTVFSYGAATNGAYTQIGTAVAGSTPVANAAATGLTAATTYYFRAVTTDSEGTPVTVTSPSATTGTPLATGAPVVAVPVTDPNLFFSPYNWYSDGAGALAASNVKASSTIAVTNNPGAYLKVAFTGTSFALNVDTTPLSGAGTAAGNYPVLRYSVDNAIWVTIQLASGVTTPINLSGLSAGTHTIYIIYWQSAPTIDRWTTTPLPVDVVKITGITLASGGATASLAGTPLSIKSKNLLAFGDSITEGLNITGTVAPTNADALASYVALVADGLGAEIGVVGFGGLGWQWTGGGNVVPLYTPGNDAGSSWNKYFAGQSRLVSGLLSPAPDYVTVAHGTNDGLNGVADFSVTASVTGWIAAVRAAAPTSPLFVLMPFGQFKVSAIQAGVTAAADPRTSVVNLGANFSTGLTSFSLGANARSTDGIHPPAYVHSRGATEIINGMRLSLLSAPNNVRSGTDRGDGTAGTLVVPAAAAVLTGTTFDNGTAGTVVLPAAGAVKAGTTFGAAAATTGTYSVALPSAGNVLSGVTYGAPQQSLTGSYVPPVPAYASAADVRSGTNRGDGTTGTLVVPPAASVLTGTTYDANTAGTVVLPAANLVKAGTTYGPASNTTGTYSPPAPAYASAADVRYNTDRGDGTLGTLRVPTASQVLTGVLVDATSGNVLLPASVDVRAGVAYGPGTAVITGSLTVAAAGLTTDQAAAIALLPAISIAVADATQIIFASLPEPSGTPQIAIPVQTDPALCTGCLRTYDAQGAPQGSVQIAFVLMSAGGSGASFDRKFTATSDANGYLYVPQVQGAGYQASRPGLNPGVATAVTYTVPMGVTSFALPVILGSC